MERVLSGSRGDERWRLGLPCPCSRLWCVHVLTASQGSGTSVEFGSGFAKRKIEEGPFSPDSWFVLSTRPGAYRGEKAACPNSSPGNPEPP